MCAACVIIGCTSCSSIGVGLPTPMYLHWRCRSCFLSQEPQPGSFLSSFAGSFASTVTKPWPERLAGRCLYQHHSTAPSSQDTQLHQRCQLAKLCIPTDHPCLCQSDPPAQPHTVCCLPWVAAPFHELPCVSCCTTDPLKAAAEAAASGGLATPAAACCFV